MTSHQSLLVAGGLGVITLTAVNAAYLDAGPGPYTVGIRWRSDGSITVIQGPSEPQANPRQWWSDEPVTGIGALHEIRALSAGAVGSWDTAAAADDTWISIASNRLWSFSDTVSRTVSRTFEIRRIGTTAPVGSDTGTADLEVTP